MPKVSVIIPVYNTEKYLQECLDSLIHQTLEDIEIICVNDGSTDDSARILDEYAAVDKRVKVIHQQNGGVTMARKKGILEATGDYVGFVDSDDWIEKDMYERLYSIAIQNDMDMVSSGYYLEGNYITVHVDAFQEGAYMGDSVQHVRDKLIFYKEVPGLRSSLCCKLFSTKLFKAVLDEVPSKLTYAEDRMYTLIFALNCESIYIVKEAFYHYRIHQKSAVHTSDYSYLERVNEVYKCLIKLYEHPNFSVEMRMQAELYITGLLITGINSKMGFNMKNLLWIDPYWLEKIPTDSKVILYGGGELGEKYRKHLSSRQDIKYITCIDYNYQNMQNSGLEICSPSEAKVLEYDYIVITIKNPAKAEQVRKQLVDDGIDEQRILWFEQKEIFWKYAEADGLVNS